MIVKTVIKYKLIEWAVEAFFNGFSKLVSNHINNIFLRDAIVGKRYKSLHLITCQLHSININDKFSDPSRLLIEYEYSHYYEDNTITFFAYIWDKNYYIDNLPERLHKNMYISKSIHYKIVEYYGVDEVLVINIPKNDFDYYYDIIKESNIYNYREIHIIEDEQRMYLIPL